MKYTGKVRRVLFRLSEQMNEDADHSKVTIIQPLAIARPQERLNIASFAFILSRTAMHDNL